MRHSRLFLQIFGWFWLALAAMLLVLLLMLVALDANVASTKWAPSAAHLIFQSYAAEALNTLRKEGQPGLLRYLQSVPSLAPGHVYLFDSRGTELAGQNAPERVRELAESVNDPKELDVRMSVRRGMLGAAVVGPDSLIYKFVIELNRRPTPIPSFGFSAFLSALLALAVLVALCLLIARQLAAPLMQIGMAARRFAGGDLSARALDVQMARRKDEFADLARDFDEMAGRISTLLHVQERLLWDISHELRSPLTRLSLALGIARRKAGMEVQSSLDRIERETEQLNRLIEHLLTIARLKGGAGPSMTDCFDLTQVVGEVVTDADFEARARNRSVTWSPGAPCTVKGSREMVKSAIENVVRNAVRHTSEGSVVEVSLTADRTRAVLHIRDHGPGVPDAALKQMFDAFFRVPEKGETGGSGLGLAITKQAVLAHAGSVRALNAKDGGLMVEIDLPITPAATSPGSR